MEIACEEMLWLSIPSLRHAAIKELARRGATQQDIASWFGVSQAYVSKVLSSQISNQAKRLVRIIEMKNLHSSIVSIALSGKGNDAINSEIDRIASSRRMANALRLSGAYKKANGRRSPSILAR
ncbi:MAG: hypothetical protein QXN59_03150 [Candidatus Micrarchaeaceae archaeon]